jgi:predicted aspartyl protease
MNRRTLLVRLAAIGAAVGGGWWLKDNVLWRRPDVTFDPQAAWIAWDAPRTGLPTVRATVGGQTVRALIDSGAQFSVIDRGLFEQLGLDHTFDMPLLAYGVGGVAQLGKGVTLDVGLGALRISNLRAAILDLGPLAAEAGLGAPLILGQDVLSQGLLDLDVERRRLRFLPPGSPTPGHVLPVEVRRTGRALATTITVEGAVIEAVVDTGASGLLSLSREAALSAGLLDDRPRERGSSLVLGGSVASTVVEARTVTFGDQLYRRVRTAIYGDVAVPGYPAALIGMEAFEGRRLILDMGGGRLLVSRDLELTVGREPSPRGR